jgi:hypothetical protein
VFRDRLLERRSCQRILPAFVEEKAEGAARQSHVEGSRPLQTAESGQRLFEQPGRLVVGAREHAKLAERAQGAVELVNEKRVQADRTIVVLGDRARYGTWSPCRAHGTVSRGGLESASGDDSPRPRLRHPRCSSTSRMVRTTRRCDTGL